jgi:uncharacterized integral membrane protein
MRMQTQAQPAKVRRSISARTVLLITFVIIVTVFAVQNWTQVPVWPLGGMKPLALVIGISFVLGAFIGWLAHSILLGRRGLAPDRAVIREDNH